MLSSVAQGRGSERQKHSAREQPGLQYLKGKRCCEYGDLRFLLLKGLSREDGSTSGHERPTANHRMKDSVKARAVKRRSHQGNRSANGEGGGMGECGDSDESTSFKKKMPS